MAETVEQGKNQDNVVSSTLTALPETVAERKPSEMSQEEIASRDKARRYRLRYIDLRTEEPAYNLIHELPVELMVHHCFVPMSREGNVLYVAMADPTNLEVIDEIEAQLHVRLKPAVATQTAVEEALKRGDTAAPLS